MQKKRVQKKGCKRNIQTFFENLDTLQGKEDFYTKFNACEKIFVKPNLVSVYHKAGMKDSDYPESTDPRVFQLFSSCASFVRVSPAIL